MVRRLRLIPPTPRQLDPLRDFRPSVMHIDGCFFRVHRIGAPGPAAPLEDTAHDSRITFVLLHGIGLSARYLAPVAHELAKRGEVLVIDFPGFGGLPHPARSVDNADLAAMTHKLLREARVRDPILIGHSWGAQIAVELMTQHQSYQRAVLVGPPVNAHERSFPWVIARYLQSSIFETPALVAVAIASYLRSSQVWTVDLMPELLRYPIGEKMKQLPQSTEVIVAHGAHDYLAPDYWVEELANSGKKNSTAKIAGAAHCTVFQHDEEVAQLAFRLIRPYERPPEDKPVENPDPPIGEPARESVAKSERSGEQR